MKRSEAARVVAVLGAFFPSRDIREDTAELWENAIVEYEVADALEATQVLGEGLRFMPSLAEFIAATKDARNQRLRTAAVPLPSGSQRVYTLAEAIHDNPVLGEKLKAMDIKPGGPAANVMIETFAHILRGEIRE